MTLTIPSVNKSKAYLISTQKYGYIDYFIVITVYPSLSPENIVGFLIVIVFWAAYEQAGGLMNIYTHDKINREILGLKFLQAYSNQSPPYL